MSVVPVLAAGTFYPGALFSAGEQGVWYDPSDLTTMFEDASGTTAVHTPGNGTADSPVGLLLDKHSNGVGTNGAARYNVISYSEQFNNAFWSKGQATVTADATTAPDGTTTADAIYETAVNNRHYVSFQGVTPNVSSTYNWSICLKAGTRTWATLYMYVAGATYYTYFDLANGVVGNNAAGTTASMTSLGSGWYRCTISRASVNFNGVNGGGFEIALGNGTNSYLGDVTKYLYAWGADARLTSQAALTPTYQPITASWAATMAGNHATQSTSTARPTLSARYNLLTYSEQFDNAAWTKQNITITANSIVAPDGTTTADLFTSNSTNTFHLIYPTTNTTITAGLNYTSKLYLKAGTQRYVQFWFGVGNTQSNFGIVIDTTTMGIVTTGNGTSGTYVSSSVTNVGSGWYLFSITGSITGQTSAAGAILSTSDSTTYSIFPTSAGNGTIYIWGADLRPTNDGVGVPTYQRIADANTYDSTGFPYYLKFDGVDDSLFGNDSTMPTGDLSTFQASRCDSSNFGTGAYAIFANYGKVQTSGAAVILGYGTDGNAGTNAAYVSQWGSALGIANLLQTRLVFTLNRVGTLYSIRSQGGATTASKTMTTNTQTYGTNGLVLGRYGAGFGGSNYAGRNYGLIIRGASSTSTEIANAETWLNTKTKAY